MSKFDKLLVLLIPTLRRKYLNNFSRRLEIDEKILVQRLVEIKSLPKLPEEEFLPKEEF